MVPVAAAIAAGFMSFQGGKEPWVAPASASKVANPVKKSDAGMKDAKKVFSSICQTCHGADGTGNGPAAQALILSSSGLPPAGKRLKRTTSCLTVTRERAELASL